MVWKIKYSELAAKQMQKLDKSISRQITQYLDNRIAKQKDPRVFGKSLSHEQSGLWRYRVEDYRIICELRDHELVVLVLRQISFPRSSAQIRCRFERFFIQKAQG